jgi:glycosyltransferase involved in cell wall biosynthesis
VAEALEPVISVVVPAYNAERTLDSALAPLVGCCWTARSSS